MSSKKYRVIQWCTGVVGKAALRGFIQNPEIELVGVYVTSDEKDGMDAGDIVGLPKTGVLCTRDAEALIAMEADAVLYAPHVVGISTDLVCRLLASGKNVISPAGPFLPNTWLPDETAKIAAACAAGNSSFHPCGIHPGYSGDILPITLARLMNRIDFIEVAEIIDKVRNPMIYTEMMGFGADCDELLANPRRSPETYKHFYASMTLVAAALGVGIDEVTVKFEVSKALKDVAHEFGLVKAGTCGGQHYEWIAWAGGKPFLVYHFYWQLGTDLEPLWEQGEARYRVRIHGDPGVECNLMGLPEGDGRHPFLGLPWTGIVGATAVPAVCEAAPGLVTHIDLGVVQPHGLVVR